LAAWSMRPASSILPARLTNALEPLHPGKAQVNMAPKMRSETKRKKGYVENFITVRIEIRKVVILLSSKGRAKTHRATLQP
jgi:hypothetical protein